MKYKINWYRIYIKYLNEKKKFKYTIKNVIKIKTSTKNVNFILLIIHNPLSMKFNELSILTNKRKKELGNTLLIYLTFIIIDIKHYFFNFQFNKIKKNLIF